MGKWGVDLGGVGRNSGEMNMTKIYEILKGLIKYIKSRMYVYIHTYAYIFLHKFMG